MERLITTLTDRHLEVAWVLDLHAEMDLLDPVCLRKRIAAFFDCFGTSIVGISNLSACLQRRNDELGGGHLDW